MARAVAPVWSPSQAAAERETKRRPTFYTYMNLWPFVAVLLVLLVMFMLSGPPIHGSMPVDLPRAFHTTAQPKGAAEDAMKIYVTRDGRVYFRNTSVQVRDLPIVIRGAVGEGAEKKVYMAVDSRARYGDAAMVVEQIANAGIREICFLASKLEK